MLLHSNINPANYTIREARNGTYHFTLHDKDGDMLARRIQYFKTREECETARDECVAFLGRHFAENEMVILEHMLLRPYLLDGEIGTGAYKPENDDSYLLPTCFEDDDCNSCGATDAYSFRITVIIPSWPEQFQDMNFRNFLARFIREQTPAHIFARICWISQEQMTEFSAAYQNWKDMLAIRSTVDVAVYLDALERLIAVWRKLRSVYPQVHLYDCTDVKNITPTVLGDSALGVMNGARNDQD